MKASVPKGTRDFNPEQVLKRNYIFNTLKKHFELSGYLPIETPSMENLDTLTGKYGDEGDQLIFKILNSGDFKKEIDFGEDYRKLASKIAEKALRYDLTVPFARFVVQNRNNLALPFKRYQIQPVWRADRPQKGRYREFYQCDIDVIGSDSLLNEAEQLQIAIDVFKALKLDVKILINNRKLLESVAEWAGCQNHFVKFTVALDKLDKVGKKGVLDELVNGGISTDSISRIETFLNCISESDNHLDVIHLLEDFNMESLGIKETKEVLAYLHKDDRKYISVDLTLARGLNYYTGCIFEIKANQGSLKSSIGGGGRYDNLTAAFGWEGISGVGISFGADRIYDVLEECNLFPKDTYPLNVLFISTGKDELQASFETANLLKTQGLVCRVYPLPSKIQKQLEYANKIKANYAIIIGEEELKNQMFTIKNLDLGEQKKLSKTNLLQLFESTQKYETENKWKALK